MRLCLLALAVLSLGSARPEYVVTDHVDVIELNHVYEGDLDDQKLPRRTLSQVIFWQDNEIRDWVWATKNSSHKVKADADGRQWLTVYTTDHIITADPPSCIFHDRDGVLRRVTANVYHETFTQTDREIDDKANCPKHKRKPLSPGVKR